MSAAVDAPIRALLERIAGPAAAETPDLRAIGAALVDLAADTAYITRWVARLGDRAATLPVHAPPSGPRLSLVRRPEGQLSAVHDHGTWVAMCPISGLETHRRYVVDADPAVPPRIAEIRRLEAADFLTLLPPDDVHDHGHVIGQGEPACVLILTGDNQTRFPRQEWDIATGRRRILAPGDRGRWLASEPMPRA